MSRRRHVSVSQLTRARSSAVFKMKSNLKALETPTYGIHTMDTFTIPTMTTTYNVKCIRIFFYLPLYFAMRVQNSCITTIAARQNHTHRS